jgi:hypothetical protein
MLRQGAGLLAQAAAAAAGAAPSGAAAAAPALGASRALSAAADDGRITATLFPGDGIGPEIATAVRQIFEAAQVPVDWDEQHLGKTVDERTNSFVTRENLDSVLVSKGGLTLRPSRQPLEESLTGAGAGAGWGRGRGQGWGRGRGPGAGGLR